jgi:hypothetical protein
MTACSHCGRGFTPRRSTARYCGDACRKRASREKMPAGGPRAAPDAFFSVTGTPVTTEIINRPAESRVTLKVSSKPAPKLPPGIVPDGVYPGMYRVRLPDGTLSDMVNLTRARDAARALAERERRSAA